MSQAHPKPVWHLSRGHEQYGPISDRELLLLAELGKLQANDLLWRPGFDGWRTALGASTGARSVPGLLTPPPLPSSISLSEQLKQIGAKAITLLSLAVCTRLTEHVARWRGEFRLLAKEWLRLIQLYVRGAYRHIKRVEFDLETFLGRVEHPRNLAGLLVAVVLVGVLVIAVHKSFATDTQPALQYPASPEPRPKPEPATANAVNPLESTGPELEAAPIVRTVRVFSIDNLQPSDGLVLVPDPGSEAPLNSVPLPTKKPERPIISLNAAKGVRASTAAPRRMSQIANRGALVDGFRNMDGP